MELIKMEDVLVPWLRTARGRRYQLVIAGRISGIHDEIGIHEPIACQLDDSTLTIEFNGLEHLTIANLGEIIVGANNELVVRDAEEVYFIWYSCYSSQFGEEVFRKAGKFITFNRIGSPFATSGFFLYRGDEFIRLRQVKDDK